MLIRSISVLDLRSLRHFLGPAARGPGYQSLTLMMKLMRSVEKNLQIRLNSTKPRLRDLYPLLDDNDVLHDEVFQFSHKQLPSHTFHQLSFITVDPRGKEGHTKHYNAVHLS